MHGVCREAAAGHTGQFSWRAGPSGTVLAQHGSAPSTTGGPARGPWANTGMVRARLAGLSFGGPAQLGQHQVCTHTSAAQFHRQTFLCERAAAVQLIFDSEVFKCKLKKMSQLLASFTLTCQDRYCRVLCKQCKQWPKQCILLLLHTLLQHVAVALKHEAFSCHMCLMKQL